MQVLCLLPIQSRQGVFVDDGGVTLRTEPGSGSVRHRRSTAGGGVMVQHQIGRRLIKTRASFITPSSSRSKIPHGASPLRSAGGVRNSQ